MTATSATVVLTTIEWVEEIRPHLEASIENIVAAGTKLNEAKSVLPHGHFGPLLVELGLSRQMANRFMRVAGNDVIANRSPVGGLPVAVSVLDVLTQLEDDELVRAIASGTVSANTTRTDAVGLVKERRQQRDADLDCVAKVVAALIDLDDALDQSRAPIQARDVAIDLGLLFADAAKAQPIDDLLTIAASIHALAEHDDSGIDWPTGWLVAAMFVTDIGIRSISTRFTDQIADHTGVGMIESIEMWLNDETLNGVSS